MSKANNIRKKALECARRQDWESAIREYRRLAEIDQANPNIHNELGDIYIKVGEKTEAYSSFATAIDAYTRVSLYNNAVAVCKKVIRIVPARYEVHAKLGCIRKKQGLAKEAESYCLQYLERLAQDTRADATEVAKTAESIVEAMEDSAVVLDRLAETLLSLGIEETAAQILAQLHKLYDAEGPRDARDQVRRRLEALGMGHLIQPGESPREPAKEGPVITEENIWTDSHSEGERIVVERAAHPDAGEVAAMGNSGAPEEVTTPADYREVALPNGDTDADHEAAAPEPAPDPDAAPAHADLAADKSRGADSIHVSSIIDASDPDGTGSVDQDDYRSHYDLGMAYLEMNLFSEAVREFQLASKSSEFLVKSLEMVGLCFLKKDQPQLAIKQLQRGLSQIDENDADALGIKYNLGLAYEMIGDDDRAQALFEDVYVVDITFRDVAEKVARYTQS